MSAQAGNRRPHDEATRRRHKIGAAVASHAEFEVPLSVGQGPDRPPPSLVTPLGTDSPSSVPNQIRQTLNLIISFFTSVYVTLALREFQGFELLLLMFIVLFIWNEFSSPLRNWLATYDGSYGQPDDGSYKWPEAAGMILDIFSRILVLIVFETASELMFELWRRAGLTEVEKIAFGVTIVIVVSALFHYVLYACGVDERDKKIEENAV